MARGVAAVSDVLRTVVYGQAEDCDVQITDDPYVSNHHARVTEYIDGRADLEDLGSTNGTWMLNVRVWGRWPLGDGNQFRIGRTAVTWTATPRPQSVAALGRRAEPVKLPPWPVDDTALDLLYRAVYPDPLEADRSSLNDLLAFYSEMGGSDVNAVATVVDDGSGGGPAIHEMRDPQYHSNDVIAALVEEIRRLRMEPSGRER
jgi:hypothetical protein